MNLAIALKVDGDVAGELEARRRSVELEPGSVEAHLFLAKAFRENNMNEQALCHYNCAQSLDPSSVDAVIFAGAALKNLGRLREALEEYKRGLKMDMGSQAAQGQLATISLM